MADQESKLEDLFVQARKTRNTLPEDLAVRIETDAEALRLRRHARATKVGRRRWIAGIGGWQGLGSLIMASAAGVWIGFSAPSFLPDPAELLSVQDSSFLLAELNLDYLEDTE